MHYITSYGKATYSKFKVVLITAIILRQLILAIIPGGTWVELDLYINALMH